MDDLFRFWTLRAAKPAQSEAHDTIAFSDAANRDAPRKPQLSSIQVAALVRASPRFVASPASLRLAPRILKLADKLGKPPFSASEVRSATEAELGPVENLIASDEFRADSARLGDSLLAMKLLSSGRGANVEDLVALRRLYTLIERSVSVDREDPLEWLPIVYSSQPLASDVAPPLKPSPKNVLPDSHSLASAEAVRSLQEIDTALLHLSALRSSDFHESGQAADEQALALPATAHPDITGAVARSQARVFRLSASAVTQVPDTVANTLSAYALDIARDSVPQIALRLEQVKSTLSQAMADAAFTTSANVVMLGTTLVSGSMGVGGEPRLPMPTGKGSVAPVGIGDLLVVRQHTKAYVGGDVAHIENVLKSEKMSRETRRLERTETAFFSETEKATEEERDTQSTDRFSLKQETSETMKSDLAFKAGVAVTARYGPMVEVKATTDLSSTSSTDTSTKASSEFSKDIVSRSVSKITEKIHERRTVTTTVEFEEKVGHGFDNTAGAGHISGVYQWVDKLVDGQVYNYGKRLMFDVVVPEPASFYIQLLLRQRAKAESIEEPKKFNLSAAQINEGNYEQLAREYGATGIEPPPPLYKTITKAWDGAPGSAGQFISKSESIAIDDGYEALTASIGRQRTTPAAEQAFFRMVLGTTLLDIEGPAGHVVDMDHRIGSIAVSFQGEKILAFAINLEVLCRRTPRATQVWQQKMHAAISQAYAVKRNNYERAIAEARASIGVSMTGRNPGLNAAIISSELKKSCISLITAQFFDAFGAINLSSAEQYPEIDIAAAATQGAYLRFFEQAFEWEHIMYSLYPYFWGLKKHWAERALLDDTDPVFAQYLRSGAARVVFPVRPGFEEAIIHFLETGAIWEGGDLPDIHDSTYLSIVEEVKEAQGAPGSEVAVGASWTFRLPTTLVRLRPDDKLPRWKKVAEQWEEDGL